LPRKEFVLRLGWSVAAGLVLILFSLSIGMLGYHFLGASPGSTRFSTPR